MKSRGGRNCRSDGGITPNRERRGMGGSASMPPSTYKRGGRACKAEGGNVGDPMPPASYKRGGDIGKSLKEKFIRNDEAYDRLERRPARSRIGELKHKQKLHNIDAKYEKLDRDFDRDLSERKRSRYANGGGVEKLEIKIKHPGALHKKLGVPMDKKIPEEKIDKALHSRSPSLRKQANFAKNARNWNKK